MTNKAYIVANEEQELKILTKLEQKGYTWHDNTNPTKYVPSEYFIIGEHFPISISSDLNKRLFADSRYEHLNGEHYDIVYDGRKESKIKIRKELYDELVKWKHYILFNDGDCAYIEDLNDLSNDMRFWIYKTYSEDEEDYVSRSGEEIKKRLIAIINFIDDDDVFEVEKPKKWVVRYKETDYDDKYWYILTINRFNFKHIINVNDTENATKFDTKEEAESWANSHQEVVEVSDD